jgi:hypothetical protein
MQLDIQTLVASILGIEATTFKKGLAKGQKPVKLACKLGADYHKASLLASLNLAVTATEINAVYADETIRSCMTGKKVGEYYAQMGVSCLHGANFRALVVEKEGVFYTPRCYGVAMDAVADLLGEDLLVVSRDKFGIIVSDKNSVTKELTPKMVSTQSALYQAEYEFNPSWGSFSRLRDKLENRGDAPFDWKRYSKADSEAISLIKEAAPTQIVEGDLSDLSNHWATIIPIAGVICCGEYLLKKVKRIRSGKAERVWVKTYEVKRPRGVVTPYLDFPLEESYTLEVEAPIEKIDSESVGYDIEARLFGYAY